MKVLQINGGSTGSTGKIMIGIKDCAESQGIEVVCASPVTTTNRGSFDPIFLRIGSHYGRLASELLARITGYSGCFSILSTVRLISFISKYLPDIIHLHTLHSSFINIPMLFKYIKKHNISVVWTLHDCWAFTGHCPHFLMTGCDKWEKGCMRCPQYKDYPISYIDNSKRMYKLKKKWFKGIDSLLLVTPSKWLADLLKRSFLNCYPVKVINNGIDLQVFKPTDCIIRAKYHISSEKHIVLGVAYGWDKKKGLDVFIELSHMLDPEKYQIMLVGTNEQLDVNLPKEIISVHRTQNQRELAEIYTAADVFVNPTREDTFPTVNIEALACGTPVITFKTGGSPEIIDETCGCVVECDDITSIEKEIVKICNSNVYTADNCINRAKEYSKDSKFLEYVDLYLSILNGSNET